MILGEAGLEGRTLECLLRTMLLERSEHANSDMAAGVVTWRRDNFSGLVDDQCRYYLGKFRPQEVPRSLEAPALPLALIHPSAWKGSSYPNFAKRSSTKFGYEDPLEETC